MNVKFYTQGCPKCKVLKAKLDQAGVEYELVDDFSIEELRSRGVMSLPILEVDGNLMKFSMQFTWLSLQKTIY